MVTKFLKNSNFSYFLAIKSEINHCENFERLTRTENRAKYAPRVSFKTVPTCGEGFSCYLPGDPDAASVMQCYLSF